MEMKVSTRSTQSVYQVHDGLKPQLCMHRAIGHRSNPKQDIQIY